VSVIGLRREPGHPSLRPEASSEIRPGIGRIRGKVDFAYSHELFRKPANHGYSRFSGVPRLSLASLRCNMGGIDIRPTVPTRRSGTAFIRSGVIPVRQHSSCCPFRTHRDAQVSPHPPEMIRSDFVVGRIGRLLRTPENGTWSFGDRSLPLLCCIQACARAAQAGHPGCPVQCRPGLGQALGWISSRIQSR
jgi:hypothetical protein